ncbi:MAG: hypothetical protein ACOZAO_03400 [Patescibacteria group bacterium]
MKIVDMLNCSAESELKAAKRSGLFVYVIPQVVPRKGIVSRWGLVLDGNENREFKTLYVAIKVFALLKAYQQPSRLYVLYIAVHAAIWKFLAPVRSLENVLISGGYLKDIKRLR